MEPKQTTAHGHYEDDSITRKSTLADNPFFKLRPTGTIYKPIQGNTRGAGRGTICVPLSSFNGVSENAGFSSKLKFFNEGAKRNQKNFMKKATIDLQKGEIEDKKIGSGDKHENENNKDNEDLKKMQALYELNKKRLTLGDEDLSKNLKLLQSINNDIPTDKKTKQNNNNNNNNISSNKNQNNNEKPKIQKEKESKNESKNEDKNKSKNESKNESKKEDKNDSKTESKNETKNDKPQTLNLDNNNKTTKPNTNNNNKKKIYESLDEHWKYEDILLNYNILDFTSKYIYFNKKSFF